MNGPKKSYLTGQKNIFFGICLTLATLLWLKRSIEMINDNYWNTAVFAIFHLPLHKHVKQLQRTTSHIFKTMCKRRNAIQSNINELKIIVIYERMKGAPNFKKGHFLASKRQKSNWVPLSKCELYRPNKFFTIF